MFAAPPNVSTTIFARLPDRYRDTGRHSAWTLARGAGPMHSFLEGPSFDRSGNLYVVDLAHGRIFRISPAAEWDLFAEYDGQPNGLKIHRDGSIFVADAMHGILRFDPRTGRYETVAAMFDGAKFIGPNDLVFADNGDLWFTDPGHSGQHDPCGRVFRLATDGRLDLMIDGLAYPNGLVLTPKQDALLVGVTSSLQVIRMSLTAPRPGRWRTFVQLSGGHAGPDGLAVDEEGNFVVVHAGFGTVWQFSPLGEPLVRIRSCAGIRTTNIAYGGADMRTLYITECEDGVVLTARLSTPGRRMFSHM